MLGIALTGLIIVAVISWCGWLMRRPGTNRKGSLSLAFALVALPAAAMVSHGTKEWGALANAILFSGLLGASATAIWTVVETERNPGRFQGGSVPAVISLFDVSILSAQAVYVMLFGKST
jgi:hypothetical protein